MARPLREKGVDYFPLDVVMDTEFELIEAEFGITGFGVIVKLYQEIYRQGYYIEWTDEVAALFTKKISVGGAVVSEILRASIKRGIFDRHIFETYGVLTSHGIQKRYFHAIKKRTQIEVVKEYLLVDVTQILVSVNINAVNDGKNSVNSYFNSQSKVKKSKVNESKERWGADAPARSKFIKPTIDQITEYCAQEKLQIDTEHFFNHYEAVGWRIGKSPMVDWQAAVRNWSSHEKSFQPGSASQKRRNEAIQIGESSLDKSDLMDLVISNLFSNEGD